mmetsp:Transcript_38275/g.63498  ORF Transcript_38275/g.63498 Transcript_38275/m.63498 type:complete len:589 (-) Transcript_38275:64-1830(-)
MAETTVPSSLLSTCIDCVSEHYALWASLPRLPSEIVQCLFDLALERRLIKTQWDLCLFEGSFLTTMNLQQLPVTDTWLKYIAHHRKCLTSLDMTGCTSITDEAVASFLALGWKHLRELRLGHCKKIGDASLKQIAAIRSLQVLDLRETAVADVSPLALGPALTSLELSDSKVSDGAIRYLLTGLTGLTHLGLAGTLVGEASLRGIARLKSLVSLALDWTAPSPLGGIGSLSNLTQLSIGNTSLDDVCISSVAGLLLLTDLKMPNTAVSDIGLATLANYKRMRTLDLSSTRISNAGMIHLAGLIHLTSLDISKTAVGYEGIMTLEPLINLENLNLEGNINVTDIACEHLVVFQNLRALSVSTTRTTYRGIEYIARLPKLENLFVANCRVTDYGLLALLATTSLKSLDLTASEQLDSGLEGLAKLSCLTSLNLCNNFLTDIGAEYIARVTNLRQLDLSVTLVSNEGIEVIRKSLKKLEKFSLPTANVSRQPIAARPALRGFSVLNVNEESNESQEAVIRNATLTNDSLSCSPPKALAISPSYSAARGLENDGRIRYQRRTLLLLGRSPLARSEIPHLKKFTGVCFNQAPA